MHRTVHANFLHPLWSLPLLTVLIPQETNIINVNIFICCHEHQNFPHTIKMYEAQWYNFQTNINRI